MGARTPQRDVHDLAPRIKSDRKDGIAARQLLEELLVAMSLQILERSSNPEDESAQFRITVRDSGFPIIAERLYRPTDRVTNALNIRSEPTVDSRLLTSVEPGTPLRFLGEVPRYFFVQTPTGIKGWVSKKWVKRIR